MTKAGNKAKAKPGARALARLLAVQALYLLRMNKDATTAGVLEDLRKMSLEEGDGVPPFSRVDQDFFTDLVTGVSKSAGAIRENLDKVLTGSWKYPRLEVVLASILEAGAYELLYRPDVPRAVIINEYVDVTHAFYEGKEPGFVNGILDELAKTVRS
jgi:N utilization substance protein B